MVDGKRKNAHKSLRGLLGAGVVAVMVLSSGLTSTMAGFGSACLHLVYIPVVAASRTYGPLVGILATVIVGLLLIPLSHGNSGSVTNETVTWTYEALAFVFVGSAAGYWWGTTSAQLARARQAAKSLAATYARTLRILESILAMKDEYTSGHSGRVAANALQMGHALGLHKEDLKDLYWAALLHDIGKIAVPDHILSKPGALTEEEHSQVQRHSVQGANLLLAASPEFRSIAQAIRSHHERWDGNGYPDGLRGKHIPLFGRIIAIVDVFEALTSARPYRASLSVSEALRYIRLQAGTQFDPKLVAIFEQLFAEGKIAVHNQPSPKGPKTPLL